jgi:hypothetical protein
MQPPMVGSWKVRIHNIRPFTIHSDLYYELHITRDESPQDLLAIRVPQHALSTQPAMGETYEVTFLMGQVTSAKRLD